MELTAVAVLLLWISAASLAALVIYGLDKRKSKRGAWRVPERVLLGISLLGGAPGGLMAMLLFRHKTAHWYFWSVNCLACAFWCGSLLYCMIIN
jgi:uncharacterized membrane protein YsdA (DUF1294 family)